MRMTETRLRKTIRTVLLKEFFGMFGGNPKWLKSNGEIDRNKLSPEQKKMYSAARSVGDAGGDIKTAHKAVEAKGFKISSLSKEDKTLVDKSWEKGKIAFTSGDYHGL